jgi:endoglucanase
LHKINESSWAGSGIINFYSENSPNNGSFCIYWRGADQYNNIGFDFRPDKDLTELVENDYAFDFIVRGSQSGAEFDIRFIDSKTSDPDDHPWRMRYTIDENLAAWDLRWHHVHIPLKDFTEHGSWDGEWFSPVGDYDWSAVDRFEIVAEHHDMTGMHFWFDNIHITNMDTAIVRDTGVISNISSQVAFSNAALNIYPNPFKTSATISYFVPEKSHTDITIFDISGKRTKILVSLVQLPGNYTVLWDCKNACGMSVKSGIYFCRLITSGIVMTAKLVKG